MSRHVYWCILVLKELYSLFTLNAFLHQQYWLTLSFLSLPSFSIAFFLLCLSLSPCFMTLLQLWAWSLWRERWSEKGRWWREEKDRQMAGLIYRNWGQQAQAPPLLTSFLPPPIHIFSLSLLLSPPPPSCGTAPRTGSSGTLKIEKERQTDRKEHLERGRDGESRDGKI